MRQSEALPSSCASLRLPLLWPSLQKSTSRHCGGFPCGGQAKRLISAAPRALKRESSGLSGCGSRLSDGLGLVTQSARRRNSGSPSDLRPGCKHSIRTTFPEWFRQGAEFPSLHEATLSWTDSSNQRNLPRKRGIGTINRSAHVEIYLTHVTELRCRELVSWHEPGLPVEDP